MEIGSITERACYVVETLINCWQVKLAWGAVLTVITFLLGPMDTAFLALWLMIVIDPVTKWIAISMLTLKESQSCGGLICGFRLAWNSGALNSLAMRQKFIPKVLGYLIVLIAANLLVKVLPPAYYSGKLLTEIPKDLITSYLAVTEFVSICENLTAAGVEQLGKVALYFGSKRDNILK
ncbi:MULTISPECIES: phage holin family protein [Pelosinus]|uniref:Holin toxin secretion/phage lysis n=1 Tax=Pelosinus fermentans B4 TaxID=1149862 RepID=I9LHC4_9FIRM|nr:MULTISPECIES: phage holin family protein [Pelosinus]EIW19899.1 Holin toxin secretion/phage lysis [Pelosinus fermentans B4]EIW21244.1 hypothetical protein FA11_0971 [Pelosinus fermentans A11]